jgi:glycosyltransferase involved in cell wall biosynthesis
MPFARPSGNEGVELLVSGGAVESDFFFDGLPVRRLAIDERPAELAAVVLPAIIEHQPRALLAALAADLPVIATPACGLGNRENLTIVPPDDAISLREAIREVLAGQNRPTGPAAGRALKLLLDSGDW